MKPSTCTNLQRVYKHNDMKWNIIDKHLQM